MAFIETSSPIPKGNASAENVLKDKTFSNDNGVNLIGTMPDNTTRTSNGNVAGLDTNNPTIPLRDALSMSIEEGTDGVKRLCFLPPKGYYQGNNESFIGRNASELGNASTSDVLDGETFTSQDGIEIVGAIPKTQQENGTGVGYVNNNNHDSTSYGYVRFPEKYYGNLESTSWAPEVRLSKQQMFNIVDGVLLPLAANCGPYAWGTSANGVYYDYTRASDVCPQVAYFVFVATMSGTSVQDTTVITAKINDVDQNVTYIVKDNWQLLAYCKVTINPNDRVYMKIEMNNTTQYKRALLFRVNTTSVAV